MFSILASTFPVFNRTRGNMNIQALKDEFQPKVLLPSLIAGVIVAISTLGEHHHWAYE
jgi:hypothetical protein